MGFVKGSSKACLFIGFLFILNCGFCVFAQENGNEERKVYIVYLGERQHDDPEVVAESHQRMLESVFESVEDARESIIYNYHHGFSGFAATLTDSQAKQLSDRPDVLTVQSNREVHLQSTRVNDYLGLSPSLPKGLLHESNMGSDIVIGFIDSGVWPESQAYNDEGLGPIPKHWKGECVAGQDFDPAKHCNKKLIGAKYFTDGWKERFPGSEIGENEYMSPRGWIGHGTSVSSIAASSFVPNVSYGGLAPGVMRGGAPKARIAMYKVVWAKAPLDSTSVANVVKAFDEAMKDGVDVLSISLGTPINPIRPFNSIGEDLEISSFYAVVKKGIPVIAGACNTGPDAYTVGNLAPWLLTVAATSLDRAFYVDMTLGNNITIMGQSQYIGKEKSADLVYVEDYKNDVSTMRGKVFLTFVKEDWDMSGAVISATSYAKGLILARSSDFQNDYESDLPIVYVDYEVGYKLLHYIRSSSSPTVTISKGKTLVGRPLSTQVCGFSSRGPNSVSPAILKPDIAAPGKLILSALSQNFPTAFPGFGISSGTSLSTPVVAGLVVLLKAIHPDWSPAALKSAIMTTAWKTDPYGEPIFSEGSPRKLAGPFDFGAGLVNAERAKDPGLVYDMNLDDYIHYFCASGYNDTSITILTGKPTQCSSPLPSILDVNYPAITIPDLEEEVTVTRTVSNVGPVDSVYKAVVEAPKGVKVAVEPETLVFDSNTKKLGFKVRVSSSHKSNTGFIFGSFTWSDGTRNVTIPLSVRTRVLKP
ncbi:Subtilisin-like protease SBT3.12 [Cardamine amara subsp. amara]|uniref:Subtilisin-like protease SBT3.12 n=1 Tax=Cardamine amara subsp. amara TaxID=228776 RepID=A0ABD1AF09_CARAN